jgi:predicted HTH transcriptional regulator
MADGRIGYAVAEAIVKAVVHRDYTSNASVRGHAL